MPCTPSVPTLFDNNGQSINPAFAPVTGRPGQAAYASQGGVVSLGLDGNGVARSPKVDAAGNLYSVPSNATATGTPVASANGAVGTLALGLQGLSPTAATIDAQGQLLAAPLALPTWSVYAQAVQLSSAKSLLSLMNKSTSIVRVLAVYAQNTATSPAALASYYIFAEEAHFITGSSGGTSCTPVAFDTADQAAGLPTGITCSTGATVSGEISPAVRRWISSNYALAPGGTTAENTTGDEQGRFPWVGRLDATAKPITIRPNYGIHVRPAATGNDLSRGYQDVTIVFTVAPA